MTEAAAPSWADLHLQWVEAGCDPDRFWTITPAEAVRIMKGKASLRRQEWYRTAWAAWNTEALQRTKTLPPLEQFLAPFVPGGRKLPDRETLIKKLQAAFGYPGDNPQ